MVVGETHHFRKPPYPMMCTQNVEPILKNQATNSPSWAALKSWSFLKPSRERRDSRHGPTASSTKTHQQKLHHHVESCREFRNMWVFPQIRVPQNRWFIMENPFEMDVWGYHYVRKPPYSHDACSMMSLWSYMVLLCPNDTCTLSNMNCRIERSEHTPLELLLVHKSEDSQKEGTGQIRQIQSSQFLWPLNWKPSDVPRPNVQRPPSSAWELPKPWSRVTSPFFKHTKTHQQQITAAFPLADLTKLRNVCSCELSQNGWGRLCNTEHHVTVSVAHSSEGG